MDTNWTYYGLFIDKSTRIRLIGYLKGIDVPEEISQILNNNDTKFILDHCTLLHINQVNDNLKLLSVLEDLYEYFKNNTIMVGITAIGYSDKAIAFKCVLPLFKGIGNICANKTPHITICTLNDGKPIDSNFITNWKNINLIGVETVLKRI